MDPDVKKSVKAKDSRVSSESMNEALKAWLTEEDQVELSKKIKTHLEHKKPHGRCQVCGKNAATVVCIKCGKSVCNSCYFHIVGLCEKCISKETVERWKKKKPHWETVLGVDWVD